MVVPVVLIMAALGGILLLATLACALTSQLPSEAAIPTATNVPPAEVVVVPQQIVVTPQMDPALIYATLTAVAVQPTQTPYVITQLATPSTLTTTTLQVVLPANCQVRTDWPAYVVQPGDTVGDLAIATNTALADLVVANCLATPDIINVGQTLYLPRQPVNYLLAVTSAPLVSTATPEGPAPEIGFVMVEPAVVDSGSYLIAPGNVTVRAQGVSGTARVAFYMSAVGTESAPVLVGIDNNMTDGAVILWQVGPTPFVANLWAVAIGPSGLEASTDPILVANHG
jgi:LysM repeat protein